MTLCKSQLAICSAKLGDNIVKLVPSHFIQKLVQFYAFYEKKDFSRKLSCKTL